MACTFFVSNGPITGRLRPHDAGYRPEAEARNRRGGAAARRERRRVRRVADRAAPAREDAGVRGRRQVHAEARGVRGGGGLPERGTGGAAPPARGGGGGGPPHWPRDIPLPACPT